MALFGKKKQVKVIKYPGIKHLLNGYSATILTERESTDAACVPFSSPHSELGNEWNKEKKKGHLNVSNRSLITVFSEDNHNAASATAGLALSGLRATHFSSTEQSVASMNEALYASVGKRLPYVLSITCKAITKATSSIYCSHDDYYSMADTGFIQLFAHNNQAVADLSIISRKIAELSLNPAVLAQDGFLTTHLLQPVFLPERKLISEFLGLPDDSIATPTPAQQILYGKTRRRIPETWSVDQPVQSGGIQDQTSNMQTVAGQRPYFFDHVAEIADQCMDEWFELTGRRYSRVNTYQCDDANYLIIAQGSVIHTAELTAEHLRKNNNLKVGVINLTCYRPFPGDKLSHLVKGQKGVLVLEKTDQPLSEDLPIIAEIRACISKAINNNSFNGYANYSKMSEIPPLYSACVGLGGRDVVIRDIVAAVENMLPEGKQQPFFYLGIDFLHPKDQLSPRQEIQQQSLLDAYPDIENFSLKSADIPTVDIDSEEVTHIRIYALGGQNGIDAGQSLANTLFDHFDLEVKAQPEFGVEKQGLPISYYIAAAKGSFKVLPSSSSPVNVVISTDTNVFSYCDPLAGLVNEGMFIFPSDLEDAKAVWKSMPGVAQQIIIDQQIKVFFIDAEKLVSSKNPDLINTVLKSVFFKVSDITLDSDKTEQQIHTLIDQESELVQVSYEAVQQIDLSVIDAVNSIDNVPQDDFSEPLLLQRKPANSLPIADIHRFWNQTGSLYKQAVNQINIPSDPQVALGVVPASTGVFGSAAPFRSHHLQWIPEKCNACGSCFQSVADGSVFALVNTVSEVFETNIKRIEKSGHTVNHLRRAIRTVEKKYHELTVDKSTGTNLDPIFAKAIGDTVKEYPELEREEVAQEFEWFKEAQGEFRFALTTPYHNEMNDRMPRSGGLFSLTINPDSHKGGEEYVKDCKTGALVNVKQTAESVAKLQADWNYWLDLPTSNKKFSRIDNLQTKEGILETLLLDKKNQQSMVSYGNTAAGSSEPVAIHLFTSTLTALMQPRVEQHLKHISTLIDEMEKHIRLQLVATLDISDIDALETAIDENQDVDLTLARLSRALDKDKAIQPIDPKWLKWALQLVEQLKQLKWNYTEGASGEGRASLGMTQGNNSATGWSATYPYNPYPFPWSAHLSQDAAALAMGIFEGHMVKMADGFKAIRIAELEIKGKYDTSEHENFFAQFDWHQFSEEEYLLCPPLVTVGADGTSLHSGFQSLSRCLTSGMPIKVLMLDNVPSDNAFSMRKELALIAMAHQAAFVQQGSIANTSHLLEGYIDGLNYRGSALWSIYTSKLDISSPLSLVQQSKLAMESRAHPLTTFDPRLGSTWEECISLVGNPDIDQDWINYSLDYTDEYGNQYAMDLPLTYADWALTERQFSHHFTVVSVKTDPDDLVLLKDYIEMDSREQADNIPFIWAVHPETNQLLKFEVSDVIAKATLERQAYWHVLKGLSGKNRIEVDVQGIADQAKAEMAQTITEGLMSMMGGDTSALSRVLADVPAVSAKVDSATPAPKPVVKAAPPEEKKPVEKAKEEPKAAAAKKTKGAEPHEPVWIETPDCTTCDECVEIAPAMFQYDADKKAIVIDPTAGTFEDIVRSAEKCTAVIIHPGTPWNPDEPNLEKLIKRAEKFQ